jgi:hypothetical protein
MRYTHIVPSAISTPTAIFFRRDNFKLQSIGNGRTEQVRSVNTETAGTVSDTIFCAIAERTYQLGSRWNKCGNSAPDTVHYSESNKRKLAYILPRVLCRPRPYWRP